MSALEKCFLPQEREPCVKLLNVDVVLGLNGHGCHLLNFIKKPTVGEVNEATCCHKIRRNKSIVTQQIVCYTKSGIAE